MSIPRFADDDVGDVLLASSTKRVMFCAADAGLIDITSCYPYMYSRGTVRDTYAYIDDLHVFQ